MTQSVLRITVKEKPAFKKKRDNYARKLKTKKLINYLQSELRTSTTHGLAYIANTEIHWFERVFWAICFLGSCAIIFFLLSAQYVRLVQAPIVMNVDKDYFNWNVSYPAIALCPVRKIDNEYLQSNDTSNSTEQTLTSYYAIISSVSLEALNVLDLPPPEVLELIKPEDYSSVAATVFKKFDNRTLTTLWNWPITVDTTMTEMGMCHVINSNVAVLDDPRKWKDNMGYVKRNIEISVYDIDFFVQVLNYADAYKVYTLSADEILLSGAPAFTFDTEGFLSFGVQVSSTRSSADLRNIPLHWRKCRFLHETDSIRYPVYSYNRCLLECRIKMILKLCGCIPHFYKPVDGERVCSLTELECLIEYKKEIMTLSISNETMKKLDNIEDLPKSFRDCGCLGNCEEDVFRNDHETFLPQAKINRLRVSVSAFPKVRVMRAIIFSFYDLLLRSGGVVNLCIGTSIISIMELIMTALRIPIYEIMQISKAIWRKFTRPQIQKMSLIKKQI